MAEKYPEFYIRKRQREETYRRTVQIVVGVAILAIVGGVGGFFLYKYVLQPVRQPAPEASQLADERQQLATENALAAAPGQQIGEAAEDGAQDQQLVANLGDIPYDPSFPGVHVGVEGSNTSVALGGEGAAGEQEAGSETEGGTSGEEGTSPTPPSGREQSDSFERGGTATESGGEDSTSGSSGASGEQQKQDKEAGDSSTAKPETKPPAKSDEKESEASPPAADSGSGKMVFHVYAGTYATRDAADVAKKDLQALGFQGQIITVGSEFHVRVASLDDYEGAKAIRQKLIDSGFSKAFATRERK